MTSGHPYNCGDLVWLHNPAHLHGNSKKLHRPWTGPYRVVERLTDVAYHLQQTWFCRKRPVVHFDHLKPSVVHMGLPEAPRPLSPQTREHQRAQAGNGLQLLENDYEELLFLPHGGDGPNTGIAQTRSTSNSTKMQTGSPTPSEVVPHPPPPDPDPLGQPPLPWHDSPPSWYPQREWLAPCRLYSTIFHWILGQTPLSGGAV